MDERDRDAARGETAVVGGGNARERRWFVAALGLFLVWVVTLGLLAVVSGRGPVARPPGQEGR